MSIIGDKLQLNLYILLVIGTSLSFCDTETSDHWERKILSLLKYVFYSYDTISLIPLNFFMVSSV